MISVIRSDWSLDSVAQIRDSLDAGNIVVPLALTTKGTRTKLDIIDKAVADHHPAIEALGDHPGFVLFTSGTTGAPKAALHDFTRFMRRFGKGKAYRTVMFLLFDHIGGWNTLWYTLTAGGTPIYLANRSPDTVCATIEREQAELLPTTPTFLNMVLYTEAYKRHDLSSLKVVTYGTEPMPPATLQKMQEIFPYCKFKQTYGLSEVGILGTQSGEGTWVKVGGEGYEVDVREGILWARSETSMVGYLNAPSPFGADGWYCTGDRVEERGGYIRFLGRESDIINVGGNKVSPIMVENEILKVPGVREVVVYGERHDLMGQVVVAKVVTEKEGMENEIIRYCRSNLSKYESPVRVETVKELPVTERYKKSHPAG